MHQKKNIEFKLRWNVVLIYGFTALLCIGMIIYIASLRNTINDQRDNINKNALTLAFTNQLIDAVQNAQSRANLYAFTGNDIYYKEFDSLLNHISQLSDSVISHSLNDEQNRLTLAELGSLMKQKGEVTQNITRQFLEYNPWDALNEILQNYQPNTEKPVLISTTNQDTVVKLLPKKSFWQRLSDVFSPPELHDDSILYITRTRVDTLRSTESKDPTIENLQQYSAQAQKEYESSVHEMESKLYSLIDYDHKISQQIEDLLIELHRQTLDSSLVEIKKSEQLIHKNITLSIISGCIALSLILLFVFLIIRDINKAYQARIDLEKAKKRAEELMESRHKLLLAVSHDIKAPLSSIMGNLELMNLENADSNQQNRLTSMHHSAEHILALLSNLLNFSSLEQGKLTLNVTNFSLDDLCNEIAQMFQPLALNKSLQYQFSKHFPTDLYVTADALKLKQVLINIISNAIKYTIKGSVNIDIELHQEANAEQLIFKVSDTGIGFSESQIKEIFKPFERLENGSTIADGNGYGMYVVKGLLNLMQGSINISSEMGNGSTVEVNIPVTSNRKTQDHKPLNKQHILIIDDDNTLLTLISQMLNVLGHKATLCRSLPDFNEQLELLQQFNLVLTDREMGAISGHDILTKIKAIDADKKVILMTARSDYNTQKARSDGFDDFLYKPFSIKQLAAILNDNWQESSTLTCTFSALFPSLSNMLNNDEVVIRKVIETFAQDTADNMLQLSQAADNNDFNTAQSLCHKMLPMFVELDRTNEAEFLGKMDRLRGQTDDSFPEWKNETYNFLNQTDSLLEQLNTQFGIE